jgi:DHA2 family multidrug resistance protein
LVRKVQPKFMIFFGFLVSLMALYYLSGLDSQVSFRTLAIARIFQAVGLAFLFVPINTLAYANLPPAKSNNASALINLMRNLGGSVGISVGATSLSRRSQIHQDRLVSSLTPTSIPFQRHLHTLTQRFANNGAGPVAAHNRALTTIMGEVQRQAAMLSYLDVFVILMIACLVAAFMSIFLTTIDLKNAKPAA